MYAIRSYYGSGSRYWRVSDPGRIGPIFCSAALIRTILCSICRILFWLIRPPFLLYDSIYMLPYAQGVVNPHDTKNEPTGKEAAYALGTLVGARVCVTTGVRPDANVSLDGRLFGGYDDPHRSHGRHVV